MNEDQIKQLIRQHFGLRVTLKLFNCPTGNGWMGQAGAQGTTKADSRGPAGSYVVIKNPRRIAFGLCVGGSDLIGWFHYDGIAVFVAFEVKTKIGRPTEEQLNFVNAVKKAGGIAGIVRGVEDCELLINEWVREYEKRKAA